MTALLIIAAIIIVAVIAFVSIKAAYQSPKNRGKQGEAAVAEILGDVIPGEQYIINDLLFTTKSGNTCQIDHIYINKYGIWVIETKNYAGTIYGDDNRREWTQVLAYGNIKNKFYNPVKQNETHIYHLSKYLKINGIFNNIVAFTNRADISNVNSEYVTYIRNLKKLKTMQAKEVLSVEQMENIYNSLLKLKSTSEITEEQHIENIHKAQNLLKQGYCPRCGKKLVLRTGEYGQFYGCSGYPDCKFTKQSDE